MAYSYSREWIGAFGPGRDSSGQRWYKIEMITYSGLVAQVVRALH